MKPKRLVGFLTLLAACAVLLVGALTAPGCVSRGDWESGLEQAQAISDEFGGRIGELRQVIADIEADLDDAAPGSQLASDLRRLLSEAQDELAKLHQAKQVADQKIHDYEQRLAEVPEGASDLDTSLYMLQKGWDDVSGFIPLPAPVKEGVALGSLALAYYLRRKFASARSAAEIASVERDMAIDDADAERRKKEGVVRGLEATKRKSKALADAFEEVGGDLQIAYGPDLAREVDAIRKGA